MITIENLSRRNVLRGIGIGSGLVLGLRVGFRAFPAGAAPEPGFAPNVYVSIDDNGLVTIVAHRSEMGTGIKTGLPMVLADELDADWKRVKVVQADADVKYGDQNTDGSRSMRQFYQPLREAGAVARQMLEEAAARVWNVDPASCHAQNHAIVHQPTGRRLGFGEVVKVAADLPLPSADHLQLRFKPAAEDPRAIVAGEAGDGTAAQRAIDMNGTAGDHLGARSDRADNGHVALFEHDGLARSHRSQGVAGRSGQ